MSHQISIQLHSILEYQNIRNHLKTKPNQHNTNWARIFTYLMCPLDRDQIKIVWLFLCSWTLNIKSFQACDHLGKFYSYQIFPHSVWSNLIDFLLLSKRDWPFMVLLYNMIFKNVEKQEQNISKNVGIILENVSKNVFIHWVVGYTEKRWIKF